MSRFCWLIVGCALGALACDEQPEPPPLEQVTGTMQVAFWEDVREVPFGKVECTLREDGGQAQLWYPAELSVSSGPATRPRILVADWSGGEVTRANAFVPRLNIEEVDYAMLQLVGEDVEGVESVDCRLEGQRPEFTVVCNKTRVVPWLASGERPRPSFKVTFTCPEQ